MQNINSTLTDFSLLPWDEYEEDRKRFWKFVIYTLSAFLFVFLILGVFIEAPAIDRNKLEKIPAQVARMILEKKKNNTYIKKFNTVKKEPLVDPLVNKKSIVINKKNKLIPQKDEKVKFKPVVSQEIINKAKLKASKSGILAMSKQLSSLRDMVVIKNKPVKLKAGNDYSKRSKKDLISGKAEAGSGGIKISRVISKAGTRLAPRSMTTINTPVDIVNNKQGDSIVRHRSSEQIALVFDRYKSSFYSLYRQAARKILGLQGRVVFRIKIMPNGTVTECEIVSSELNNKSLETKLITRIKLMDFGVKNVEVWQDIYHIDFSSSG